MVMPERTFGRTVRYRRTKLGLSQAKLAELVGRSTPTIRAWERDQSRPNDPKVLAALAAILGIDERHLFDKAEVEVPEVETSPTVEQALASLSIADGATSEVEEEEERAEEPEPAPVLVGATRSREDGPEPDGARAYVELASAPTPAYVAPPEPYLQTPLTPNLGDLSYVEDESQRQLYRVRNLATLVAVVVLVIAFVWALGEGLGALGDWWDEFFGNLRL
jgi:transcriptional regulator with XRE-family HTH domain